MSLVIDATLAEKLPASVKSALANMSNDQQMLFQQEFKKKAKGTGLYVALAILFPIQLFLLGKTGLGVVFLLTAGGFWVWYIIEWFLTPKRVREFNEGIATDIVTNIKVMGS